MKNASNLSSKYKLTFAHFGVINDFVSNNDTNLYFFSNLSSLANSENLLLDTFFEPLEYETIPNVTFDQWKSVETQTTNPTPQENNTNDQTPQNTSQARLLQDAQQETPNPNVYIQQPSNQTTDTSQKDEDSNLRLRDSISIVKSFKTTRGVKKVNIRNTGKTCWVGQRSGIIVNPLSSIIIEPTPLYFRFKPEKTNPNFQDSNIYSDTSTNPPSSFDTDLINDSKSARIHSPSFYFRFLLEKDTQFPLLFFSRGDIRNGNSIAIMFHHDNQISSASSLNQSSSSQYFRAIIFFKDNQNKMFNFETNFIFETNKIHSLNVTFFQFFGTFTQIVVTFDDGKYYKASSIIKGVVFNNNMESSTFFQKEAEVFNLLRDQIMKSGSSQGSNAGGSQANVSNPGLGSILFRFSILNSGSGLLSNVLFGNNFTFVSNCLGSCPLNHSFEIAAFKESDSTMGFLNGAGLIEKGYVSKTCLSCTSLNSPYNLAIDAQSLYPFKPNSNLGISQSLTSKVFF